jgi:hypothetical protein
MILPVFWMCWWLSCMITTPRIYEDLLEIQRRSFTT